MSAALAITEPQLAAVPEPPTTITLLDLVTALSDTGAADAEVVAAVMDLLETGRIRLTGQICEEHLISR